MTARPWPQSNPVIVVPTGLEGPEGPAGSSATTHASLTDIATSGHPASVISGLGDSATLDVGTTTGTVAAGDDSRITGALSASTAATTYQPLDSDLTAVAALTTPATTISGAAQKASNLSDLASASSARTNLGLGGAAVLSVGTTAGTVAAGDDSRITGALSAATAASTYQPLDADLTAIAALTAPATTISGAAQRSAVSIPGNGDGQYVSTPDHADLDATTQLEISVRCALADWTPSAMQGLVAKWSGGSNSYVLSVNTTGVLRLTLATGAGTANVESSAAPAFGAGVWGWVKVTWRSSDGRVQFFTAADGTVPSYSQLGTNQTLASGETIVNSTAVVELGGINLRTAYYATRVDFARAIICTTIDGSAVADWRGDVPADRYLDSTGKLWTVTGTGTGWCLPF